MDNKKKTPSAVADKPETSSPIKTFLFEDVSASVFARDVAVKDGSRTFYSVSFSRSYRDSNGARKYVKTFNLEDLGKVISAAQQSDEFIRALQAENA